MGSRVVGHAERTLQMADAFLQDVRRDLDRALAAGADLPPRIRTMHNRPGHATPEYRTLAIPIGSREASPEVLSPLIAQYARHNPPAAVALAFDALMPGADGRPRPVLIAEARDRWGTRRYMLQGFRAGDGGIEWDASGARWLDPDEQEMILDDAFAAPAGLTPAPPVHATGAERPRAG